MFRLGREGQLSAIDYAVNLPLPNRHTARAYVLELTITDGGTSRARLVGRQNEHPHFSQHALYNSTHRVIQPILLIIRSLFTNLSPTSPYPWCQPPH